MSGYWAMDPYSAVSSATMTFWMASMSLRLSTNSFWLQGSHVAACWATAAKVSPSLQLAGQLCLDALFRFLLLHTRPPQPAAKGAHLLDLALLQRLSQDVVELCRASCSAACRIHPSPPNILPDHVQLLAFFLAKTFRPKPPLACAPPPDMIL